ncbi:DWNN domain-containing protein [Echria macrotheca]|uniref:DWNN domain-containing protein n=1 Tax=Echria macrotheca TaxID=438768 RepID=A0AAJ0BLQ6_9PEZI|nr:DWNN domain-containing protein [Echria macrotheca]
MASSVFFKFKSQKEPTRVEFDGTGISVFELKREIILRSGLGDGTDFDLVICADEAMKEPYEDDTEIIPRSTTVIARRMPPRIPGRGGAARYVSGKMPIHAKNSSRREQIAKPLLKAPSQTILPLSNAMTEEEKMAAVFQAQTENFVAREEEMATQQYVSKGGPKKPANVPDHDPPQGYICYRCGEKGHWIQLCPTNDNPEYDNRPRVKRTTGIPKSFLKTVDKAAVLGQNSDGDESKAPAGIMVNPDGEWVIAEPDKASWEQFQAKAKSNASRKTNLEGDKEVQERGLECPIDKKMFVDPMKTPCCEKTYCNDCITNALIESDFVCPACKTEGVLLDDLQPDSDAVDKIKDFLSEKKTNAESPKSPEAKSPIPSNDDASGKQEEKAKSRSASPAGTGKNISQVSQPSLTTTATPATPQSGPGTPDSQGQGADKKRKRNADDQQDNPKIPKAPKAMQKQLGTEDFGMGGMPGMGMGMGGMGMGMGMPMMFPNMPMMFPNSGMGMANMNPMNQMGMGMGMMNPMMAGGYPPFGNFNGGMQNPNNWGGYMQQGGGQDMSGGAMGMGNAGPSGMNMNRMNNGGAGAGGFNAQQPQQQQYNAGGGPGFKNFSHQPADEDDAYFRKPVNPHRHQNRQRRVRPSDVREL